jgi:hypothetical protein
MGSDRLDIIERFLERINFDFKQIVKPIQSLPSPDVEKSVIPVKMYISTKVYRLIGCLTGSVNCASFVRNIALDYLTITWAAQKYDAVKLKISH